MTPQQQALIQKAARKQVNDSTKHTSFDILAQALPNGLCTSHLVKGACHYGANKCLAQ
jgi:hypothetical protein